METNTGKKMITIYHNPRCGKSRDCLAFLNGAGYEIEIVHYLQAPLSPDLIRQLITLLQIKPIELVRQKEALWISDYKNKTWSDNEIIEILAKNPILIERPIVVYGNKAVIARPLEKVHSIL